MAEDHREPFQEQGEAEEEPSSAIERYRAGLKVQAFHLFQEMVGDILAFLIDRHPLPDTLPIRSLYGSLTEHEPELVAIYYRTLEFLETEGIIRPLAAEPRVIEPNGRPDAGFGLTLKGLSMLWQRPEGLFPETSARPATVGEVLVEGARKGAGEASKAAARDAVSWLFREALRWFA